MDVKEAEGCVGCLVRVSEKDYNCGGMTYMLHAAWREVSMSGSKDYGVALKDRASDGFYNTKANYISLIKGNYPTLKYIPERGNPLTAHEIMKLIGSVVSVNNKPVWLERIYKKADEQRLVWYEVGIADINFPHTRQEVPLREIMRYTGELPELPVMQNEKIAPLRKWRLEKEKTATGISDAVRKCQAETLEHLRAFAAKR